MQLSMSDILQRGQRNLADVSRTHIKRGQRWDSSLVLDGLAAQPYT